MIKSNPTLYSFMLSSIPSHYIEYLSSLAWYLKHLLNGHHYDVDHGDVVDGPRDELGFIEVSPSLSNVEANFDAPEKEEHLTNAQIVVPPAVVTLLKLQAVRVRDVDCLR